MRHEPNHSTWRRLRVRKAGPLGAVMVGLLAAAHSWADELCLTGNALGDRNLTVRFRTEPPADALFDGSHLDSKSMGLPENTRLVITFEEPVVISRVELVVYNDAQRSYNAAARARVTCQRGEVAVDRSDWVSLDDNPELLCGTDCALVWGSQREVRLGGQFPGQSVSIEIEKQPGAHQSLVREALIWGLPARLARAGRRPGFPLDFDVRDNTYSSLLVTWERSQAPAGTAYVRVLTRNLAAGPWRHACFTGTHGIVPLLCPDAEHVVTVEAVGPEPGPGNPARTLLRLPHPLEVRTMDDLWGMNHFPGGGGAHQPREDEAQNTRRMLRLLEAARVRHVRWWVPSPSFAAVLAEAGMSLLPTATFTDPSGYETLARTCGVWLTSTANEPDFANMFASEFAQVYRPRWWAARRFSPLMCIAGPALGGELVGPGADYLFELYANDLAHCVDAVDLHPYAKIVTPTPPGGHLGAPEGLLASLAGCRQVFARARECGYLEGPDPPVIVSESGHPTYQGEWFMPASTLQRQAQWVVRTHLLFAAWGVRRIFWYAFQDEGTDPTDPEQCMGIVDWHGHPKPAYYAYCTMTRLLSGLRCDGFQEGLEPPVYGVRCTDDTRYVTALWDSGGCSELQLASPTTIRDVISLAGDRPGAPAEGPEGVRLVVDESVRYVVSRKPLRIISHRRLAPPVEPQLRMSLTPTTVPVRAGEPVQWVVHLESEFDCDVRVALDCGHPWEGAPTHEELTLPPRRKAEVSMHLTPPVAPSPGLVSWDVRCRFRPADPVHQSGEFRRALFFVVPRAARTDPEG